MAILWTVVGILVPVLVGAALSLMGLSPPEFLYARVCFVAAAVVLGSVDILWHAGTDHVLALRLAVGVPIWLLIGVGLPEILQCVETL